MPQVLLSARCWTLVRCPACGCELRRDEGALVCEGAACGRSYPVVDGIPVLIDEERSLFRIEDYTKRGHTAYADKYGEAPAENGLKRLARSLVPGISNNVLAERNYGRLADLVLAKGSQATVLVVGGGIVGRGMERLVDDPAIDLVEGDVTFGPRTRVIFDAHDIPFPDACFDAVIVQGVLEHVLNPVRCVGEMHRVLADGGIVYAETPFMQQVHEGAYDFTRYTHLGHRRLFRFFEELDSGPVVGPGSAFAWSYMYFLASFAGTERQRSYLTSLAQVTGFWLKHLDPYLIGRRGSYDAASAYFFMGQKCDECLPDRELVRQYRGWIGS